ncbi:tyrosine-protein kinase Dnt-like isoform X2 [Condylostylus longicornis]|nr:tyrosine-protein kinase Dnt-like isoform X2 [Condylostylus longicornis]
MSSDPDVLPRPTLNITRIGDIPTSVQTFAIGMKCSGLKAAEVHLTISIEVILNRALNNITEITLKRKKICLLNSEIDDNNINDPLLLETVIPPQSGFITFIIGGVLALVLVALLLLIAYCARGPVKSGIPINTNHLMKTSSFQHIHHIQQRPPPTQSLQLPINIPQSTVTSIYLSPSTCDPTYATLPRYNNTHNSGYQSEPEQFHRRISEVTVQRCRVRLSNLIQEGQYGRVYKGTYNNNQEVLVKTVSQRASQIQVSLLLQEGMSLYGAQHSGILSVLGVSIEDHATPYVLYPAPNNTRNLKLFLMDNISGNTIPRGITTIQIVLMANQLAMALGHLHRHGVIHKDVATRNCVIDDQLCVKLADNSLSKDLFPGDYHCLGDNENRPIKWLALETIQQKHFSEASDTWAFGVLMWELCTFAKQPYAEVDAFEMELYLRDGYRLAQPYNCPDELFTIMAYCWALSPIERPNFIQLQSCLSDFYSQLTKYV